MNVREAIEHKQRLDEARWSELMSKLEALERQLAEVPQAVVRELEARRKRG